MYQHYGRLALSVDGKGAFDDILPIRVSKPTAAATVEVAYMSCMFNHWAEEMTGNFVSPMLSVNASDFIYHGVCRNVTGYMSAVLLKGSSLTWFYT